jgi:hypothetical protein
VTQVAPVSSAEGHVEVQNCYAEAVKVLVKDSLKRRANKSIALVESRSAPWVETTALELQNTVRCGRTLLLVQLFPICR